MRDEDHFLTFENAEAVTQRDDSLLCRVSGREVWIPVEQLGITDGVIHKPGQRGVLVMPMHLAVAVGLWPASA